MQSVATQKVDHLFRRHKAAYLALVYQKTHNGESVTLHDHEFLGAIYSDETPMQVAMKATQVGVTEYLIAKVMAKAGIQGRSVFYVIPTHPLKTRFVKNRFERTIAQTAFYQAMVRASYEKKLGSGGFESMSLKNIGDGTVAFVSSQSKSSFTEFPADDLFVDELDECDPENLIMAPERLGHSTEPTETRVGNPTIEHRGIHAEYLRSDQKQYMLRCGHCNYHQVPDYFEHVVREIDTNTYVLRDEAFEFHMARDINLICQRCGKTLDRFASGEWVARKRSPISGYHISKLFSSRLPLRGIVERHGRGLVNEDVLVRFYNADLGLPFTAPGSKITEALLDSAVRDYGRGIPKTGRCLIGVDVGSTRMHVVIGQLTDRPGQHPGVRIVYIGTVLELEDVHQLWIDYRCAFGVIDAQPEVRLARKACYLMRGMAHCYYGEVKADNFNEDKRLITVRRTPALDATKESLLDGALELPRDARSVEGYYDEMTAATRTKEEKPSGDVVYVWREGEKPDHFHHSTTYMMIARVLALNLI